MCKYQGWMRHSSEWDFPSHGGNTSGVIIIGYILQPTNGYERWHLTVVPRDCKGVDSKTCQNLPCWRIPKCPRTQTKKVVDSKTCHVDIYLTVLGLRDWKVVDRKTCHVDVYLTSPGLRLKKDVDSKTCRVDLHLTVLGLRLKRVSRTKPSTSTYT